jgi:hypothetical protein
VHIICGTQIGSGLLVETGTPNRAAVLRMLPAMVMLLKRGGSCFVSPLNRADVLELIDLAQDRSNGMHTLRCRSKPNFRWTGLGQKS